MKKLFLALALCLGLVPMTGCIAEEGYYGPPPGVYETGAVEFCDDWGCRVVTAPYYYYDGEVVYYDAHFGCWIGPHGYWSGGRWQVFGSWYHGWYGGHHYHYFHEHTGGWRGGGGWHGYHGGGHHR